VRSRGRDVASLAGRVPEILGGTLQDLSDIARHLHHHEKRLTDHVAMQLREYPMSLGSAEHLAFVPAALERVGDSVEAVARCVGALHRDDIPVSERGTWKS